MATETHFLFIICMVFGTDHVCTGSSVDSTAIPRIDLENADLAECNFTVWNTSVNYFRNLLEQQFPNFMQFRLTFDENVQNSSSPGVFVPDKWVWTYKTRKLSFPYLSWNLDYGILSFGLLDARTVDVKYVHLNTTTHSPCRIVFGTDSANHKIVDALVELIDNSKGTGQKYESNYFCYRAEVPGIRETVAYWAGLYLNYPTVFISYNCCTVHFAYTEDRFITKCTQQRDKWILCTIAPYVLGILLFLYIFPFIYLEFAHFIAESDVIQYEDDTVSIQNSSENAEQTDDVGWVFQDSKSPLTFFSILKLFWCCRTRHPVSSSRFRRLISLLLTPSVVYIQFFMYRNGFGVGKEAQDNIAVSQLLHQGCPSGLLAFLGSFSDKSFAPAFGGPLFVSIVYFTTGTLFFVLPRNLKQAIEYGVGWSNSSPWSPLCFDARDIIALAGLNVTPSHGYRKAFSVCKCSFYMLFNKPFWLRMFRFHKERFDKILLFKPERAAWLRILAVPLLLCFGIIETVILILFYGVPFVSFIALLAKGLIRGLLNSWPHNRILRRVFSNRLTIFISSVCIFIMFTAFTYVGCLVFIESFSFICQVVMHCFLAVVVYPSVSFGYLFFFVAITYYSVHLVHKFGDGYLELLSLAVEISIQLDGCVNTVRVNGNELIVSNVYAPVRTIRVNHVTVNIPENESVRREGANSACKVRRKGRLIGIPLELFEFLVRKHRPVHEQFLKVFFQLSLIAVLIFVTQSITSRFVAGASSEISEVMHVIFLVTVGALPRIFEVMFLSHSELVKHEIVRRDLKMSIDDYWQSY